MIDLLPSDDQQQIVDAARDLLAGHAPVDRLRTQLHGDPVGDKAWGDLTEFGWFIFGLPEAAGGAGVGLVEEMLLYREAGRVLLPPSVLATTLAAHAAAAGGSQQIVDGFASGQTRAGFALADPAQGEGEWLLLDASNASHLIAVGDGQVRLLAADAFTSRRAVSGIDEAVPLERATLEAGVPDAVSGALDPRSVILISSMLCGISDASLELAVEYAKMREQFGQPIGAFQAIKHRCADMVVRAETAAAQVALAALVEVDGLDGAAFQTWAAAQAALQAARENGSACIQIHGGMGFTWECHAHRYLKRAQVLTQLLGGQRAVESRLLAETAPQ